MSFHQPQLSPVHALNKRRHDRQPVCQEAVIRIASLADIPCEIRDFCQGGVFVRLHDGGGAITALHGRGIEHLAIHFTPRGSDTPLQLKGRIAHVSAHGLGVAFLQPPPAAALLALQERAQFAGSIPRSAVGRDRKTIDANLIQKTCRQALDDCTSEVLGDFFGQIGQSLMDAAERAGTNAEQAAYFETITQLKTHRPRIEKLFCSNVLAQIESFSTPGPSGCHEASATSGLSLVENSEFEDWLNLNAAIAKIENLHDNELQRIEQRLSSLTHREINNKNNPYGPGMLTHALRAAVDELGLQNSAKGVLYGAFTRALHPRLSKLYQRLDEVTLPLAENPLPAEAPSKRVSSPTEAPSLPAAAMESMQASPPQPQSQVAPQVGHTEAGGVLRAASAIWELCGQIQAAGRPAPAAVNSDHTTAVIAALQQLQAEKTAQGVDYIASQDLEERLNLALSGQGASAGTLEDGHKQALNLLGALLDNVRSESTVAAGIKSYLERLQIPLFQAAFADPSLLTAEAHPAREVINLIDQLAIATNEQGEIESKSLKQSLRTITDRIARDAAENPAVFREATAQLKKLSEPLIKARAARIARVQETCEGGQRIKNARHLIEREINSRIGGKTVPAVVPALLDAGWRQLLVLTMLRYGPESPTWSQHIGVVDKLLGWLARERPDKQPTRLEAHVLIDFVDEQLLTVCPDQIVLNRIIDDLTALLLGVGSPREKRLPEFVLIPAAEQHEEAANPLDESTSALLKQFRVGDWLKLSLASGAEGTPVRLTWIGENPTRYVFVNQKGGKQIELSPQEFARYLGDQRAAKIESLDLPLMERTSNTLMQNMQDRLRYQASHDPVTGLINRKEFIRRLDRHLIQCDQQDARYVLCLMEVDQFRIINNLCGMEAGDRMLKEICGIMGERLHDDDLLARIGDSHFGLLLGRCSLEEGQGRAENLLEAVRPYHFKSGPRSFSLGVNMGLVACAPGCGDVSGLIKNADAACLAAKQKGRNLIQFYAEDDVSLEAQKNLMAWAGRIDELLAEERLFVRCQLIAPIFPERGMAPHHEILLGIRDERGDIVSPADFVPAAERWQRMSEVDRWQIQSVFRWIRQNHERFQQVGGFSINLSGQSLSSDNFLAFLHEQFSTGDVPAEKITFEITETAAIDEFSRAEKFMRQIRRYGCKFSLDDFGSGFSSYGYLKNLQVDYLKIDGSFVRDLASSPTDYAMVKSMNEIGHSLGMQTIAEYVENAEILDRLREIGVDYAQGYGIRKPQLIDDLA